MATQAYNRLYLNCPYAEKDECKALGGRWDPDAKKWYVPSDADRDDFSRWLPDNGDNVEEIFLG